MERNDNSFYFFVCACVVICVISGVPYGLSLMDDDQWCWVTLNKEKSKNLMKKKKEEEEKKMTKGETDM